MKLKKCDKRKQTAIGTGTWMNHPDHKWQGSLEPSCRRTDPLRFQLWGSPGCCPSPHRKWKGSSTGRHFPQDGGCSASSPHRSTPQGWGSARCEHGPGGPANVALEACWSARWSCWGKGSKPPRQTPRNPCPVSLQSPPKGRPCTSAGWCRPWKLP